jgi:hypothetical protein
MSSSDRRKITFGRAVALAVYCVFATVIVGTLLLGAAMGDCADGPNGQGCSKYDHLIRLLMFPGSLVVMVVLGIFLARWVMRNESND